MRVCWSGVVAVAMECAHFHRERGEPDEDREEHAAREREELIAERARTRNTPLLCSRRVQHTRRRRAERIELRRCNALVRFVPSIWTTISASCRNGTWIRCRRGGRRCLRTNASVQWLAKEFGTCKIFFTCAFPVYYIKYFEF